VGLGARRFLVMGAAAFAGVGFALIPRCHVRPPSAAELPRPDRGASSELFVFLPFGLCVAVALAGVARLQARAGHDLRPDRVLVSWLLIELAGYFVISPYPAVRRLIGFGIAAALLAARSASLRAAEPDARSGARVAIAFGLALGVLFFGAELADARARRAVIARAVERLPQLGARADREAIWYVGHWELQFYAERGAAPADRRRLAIATERLADPVLRRSAARDRLPARRLPPAGRARAVSPWPGRRFLSTTTVSRRFTANRDADHIRIFRVTRDLVPQLTIQRACRRPSGDARRSRARSRGRAKRPGGSRRGVRES
jgi:hypothetical protein